MQHITTIRSSLLMFPLTPDQTQKTLQQLSALFSTFTK